MPDEKNVSDIGSTDSFSNALNSILSNPEMLSMISSMAEKLKSDSHPSEPQVKPSESPESVAEPTSAAPSQPSLPSILGTLAPLLSADGAKPSKRDNDRACLLRALKPYMSHDRSQAIDYIIKFSSLAEVLKNL